MSDTLRKWLRVATNVGNTLPADLAIAPQLARQYNLHRNDNLRPKTFCQAPSVNMYFAQDGEVKVCCHNSEYSIGKYPEQSIKEIWNSPAANELRDHMRRYELSHGCGICAADLQLGAFQEVRAQHFDKLPVNPNYPTMMEFLLTNQCNLECVMCKGEFSSLIRKNREKLPELQSPYDKAFIAQLEEFIPHLKETRFSGSGEAFSIDMNYDIWEMILKANPDCLIFVNTNGTIVTGRVKDILKCGKFQIGVSLDSMKKDVFEEIRINANFDKVMDNIKYFHQYCIERGTRFSIAMCVMRMNWRELPEFINFANSMDCVATFHKVWYPEEYALWNLPAAELEDIYNYLLPFDFTEDTLYKWQNRRHYKYFVSVVKYWWDEAVKREEELYRVARLKSAELMPYLQKHWQKYLNETADNEQSKQALLQTCTNQLNKVLATYKTDEQRNHLLRNMCDAPAPQTIETLSQQPLEVLVSMAKELVTEMG